jgi:VWFA-related protein
MIPMAVWAPLTAAVLGGAALVVAQQPPQTFKSSVNLAVVDVHVVDARGEPIRDLSPDDFEVQLGGGRRRVVSADLVDYATRPRGARQADAGTDDPETASVRPKRRFVLAVDEHSIQPASARAAINAAERFVDQLQPDDLVGLFAYPTGVAQHDLTTDHLSVKRALQGIAGLFEHSAGRFNLSVSDALDGASGDVEALRRVLDRECRGGSCSLGDIRQEAMSLAIEIESRISQSVGGLRGLIRDLGNVPDRKILVVVSGGLVSTDRASGRGQLGAEISALGREAALANLAVFVLHLDWSFLQAVSSRGGLRPSYFRDSTLAASGLERVAGAAGGTVLRVRDQNPDVAFDRVLRETSAYYLLGVEIGAEDRTGRARTIRVNVKRPGLHVRSRAEIVVPR